MKPFYLLLCLFFIGHSWILAQCDEYSRIENLLNKRKFDKAIESCKNMLEDANGMQLAGIWYWLGESNRVAYFHKVKEVRLKDDAGYFALDHFLDNSIEAFQQAWLMNGECYSNMAAEKLNDLDHFLQIVATRYYDIEKFDRYARNVQRAGACNKFGSEEGFAVLDTVLIFEEAHAAEITDDFETAAFTYEHLAELGASDLKIYERAGHFFLSQGDTLKAVETLDYATLLFPDSYPFFKLNLQTLLDIGQLDMAFAEIDLGLKRYSNLETDINFMKATCYHQAYDQLLLSDVQRKNYFEIAEQNYILANKITPENYSCIAALADLYFNHINYLSNNPNAENLAKAESLGTKNKSAQRLALYLKEKESKDAISAIEEMELRQKVFRQE